MCLITLIFTLFLCIDDIKSQLSSCTKQPCKNGGICLDQPDILYGYRCQCLPQFEGYDCQTKKNANGIITGGDGSISIDNGGSSININKPQQPGSVSGSGGGGGININQPGGGGISIKDGTIYLKPNAKNSWPNNPCLNGGYIVQQGLPCNCPPGYTGNTCERIQGQQGSGSGFISINTCSSMPCRNNGICKTTLNGFTCICISNFYGPRCEYIRNLYPNRSNRILGISLGTILPFFCLICLFSLCFYFFCVKKKVPSEFNFGGMGGNGGVPMNAPGGGAVYYPAAQPIYQPAGYQPPQAGYYPPPQQGGYHGFNGSRMGPGGYGPPQNSFAMTTNYNMQSSRLPTQDPEEAFKVNSPPPYEEIVKQQKP